MSAASDGAWAVVVAAGADCIAPIDPDLTGGRGPEEPAL